MSQRRQTLAIIGIIATAITLTACSATTSGTDETSSSAPSSASANNPANTGAFNDADVAFAMGMVPHHKQAVEMVDVILTKDGIDPKVIELAKRIKAEQDPEITTMTGWLSTWNSPMGSMDGMAGMDGMGSGMMSDDDMKSLDVANGSEATTLFLTQMTTHHQGALTMARTETDDGKNPDAITLAKTIITGQTTEIAEMADLLKTLK